MEKYEFLFKINQDGVSIKQYHQSTNETTPLAKIDLPLLGDEINGQLAYHVVSQETEEKLGVLNFNVEDKILSMSHFANAGELESRLKLDGDVVFTSGRREYSIEETPLKNVKKHAKDYKQLGLTKNVELFAKGTGKSELEFYEKESEIWGKEKLVRVKTSDKNFLKFLPLIIYEHLIEDVKDKKIVKVEKGMPNLDVIIKKRDHQNPNSKYVKWVRENFPPEFVEEAFPYQQQDKEQTKFWTYFKMSQKGLLLHGPTGNGKSTMVWDHAFRNKIPLFHYTGHENTKLKEFTGMFVPSDDKPIKAPSALVLALVYDGIFHLEEIGPISSEVLTGLNTIQDRQPFPIVTQFGVEYIKVGPNFRWVATGNLGDKYTRNRINDPVIQRFIPIETGYPNDKNTEAILRSRAPKVEQKDIDVVMDLLGKFRAKAGQHNIDVGLRGPVEVLTLIEQGALDNGLNLGDLVKDNMIEPLSIYNTSLKNKLIDIAMDKGVIEKLEPEEVNEE
ncbi:MAG: AAA family ATPase [Nanoarchaeota archaeon]|nr:AAA family ATPase [Nanoarchaeota archaeon]MCG2718077.1 AAA family ATPase [Nanoarchaeota archaeon]